MKTDRQRYLAAKHDLDRAKRRLHVAEETVQLYRGRFANLAMYSAGLAASGAPEAVRIARQLDSLLSQRAAPSAKGEDPR